MTDNKDIEAVYSAVVEYARYAYREDSKECNLILLGADMMKFALQSKEVIA